MGRIKKIIESLTYEKQMFIKLLGLVTLPLIVMGIVSCNIYIRAESAKSRLTLNSYSDEMTREYENIFSSMKEYYLGVVNEDAYKWLIRQETVPYAQYTNLKEAQRDLEGNYFMEKYIRDYEFINVTHGWVFNNYGLFPYESIRNKEATDRFIEEQKEVPMSIYWLNRPDAMAPVYGSMRATNSVDSSGLLLVIKGGQGISGISWLLSAQVDERQLKAMSEGYQKLGYDIAILGNDGVLLESNSHMTETYLERENGVSGFYKNGRIRYNINVTKGETSGLTYVVGYDTSKVKQDATVFVFASFAVIAAFALILILVRVTAVAFAKPLLLLEKYADDQNKQIKELLVSNLIKGELNEANLDSALKKSEVEPWPVYRMIALICKGDNKSETENLSQAGLDSEENQSRENYEKIIAGLPEEIRAGIFITPLFYRDKLICLVGAENDIEIDTKMAMLYKEMKDYIAENFGYATASGISQPFHKLSHVRRAYNECGEALYNRTNKEDMDNSSLVLFDDYLVMNQVGNVYDMIMENELIQSIESCNEEEANRLLELIVDRMDSKSVVGIERNFYLTRLLTAMLNVPATAGISLSDIFDSGQYNVLNHITQIYDKKKVVKAAMEEIIHPVIEKLSERQQEGNELELVTQIMAIIKETKGNISLNECADTLSYHPNYLSKVLKREKGVTFTEIVNEEKLKQAKYMLLTTEYSVAEISERLHYNNVQNFIRFFKNQVGSTPAAFRKEHRE